MSNTIETNLQRLLTATSDIADAIEAKGGTVGANDGLEAFPTAIATIPNGNITDVQYTTRTLNKYTAGSLQPTPVLTVDETPTANSNNPIASKAIYSSLSVMNDILEEVLHSQPKVYGIVWDKTNDGSDPQNPAITRTDDSASFSNPNPYYSGMSETPSSPFDTLQPWAGMVKETIDGNSMVKIPKFYYKIVNGSDSMTIQIADGPKNGFKISPAHRAQNSNDTIKDYIYIGRYKCNSSYGSTTGQTPLTNITRSTARSGCRALDNNSGKYDQLDFATWWTIRMLYLVEFANWNCQAVIGGGCSTSGSIMNTGYTDSITYHTGTTASSISTTAYGGTQYRWIEGLWDNVLEWCDGITFNNTDVYTFNDRANYSDSYTATGAIKVGTRASTDGETKDFFTPSTTSTVDYDIDWMMYTSDTYSDSNYATYTCDFCQFSSSGVVLFVGGYYYQDQGFGLGQANGSASSSSSLPVLGVRLLRYP